MGMPTLEELRGQCRVDSEDEDDLLQLYAAAAKQRAESYLCRKLYDETVPDEDPEGLVIGDDVKLAIMLAVGFWYSSREASVLPQGFYLLIQPYRYIPL
ncbi:head-tail connector protein [Enterobacter kobei]|uniref:head-tail connector protein n=2 Tax=Enterobacter cloacae complex TaxID=354276 RepID=UPI0007B36978|nr:MULTISPECIES: head-tail connector protein [Enterobacter cloacae complex]KZQ32623.1 hypothetical protein A3464_00040 [Enterobacter genomosp. O]MBT1947841.1 head-tail connector protein [Enterobacter kobei]